MSAPSLQNYFWGPQVGRAFYGHANLWAPNLDKQSIFSCSILRKKIIYVKTIPRVPETTVQKKIILFYLLEFSYF